MFYSSFSSPSWFPLGLNLSLPLSFPSFISFSAFIHAQVSLIKKENKDNLICSHFWSQSVASVSTIPLKLLRHGSPWPPCPECSECLLVSYYSRLVASISHCWPLWFLKHSVSVASMTHCFSGFLGLPFWLTFSVSCGLFIFLLLILNISILHSWFPLEMSPHFFSHHVQHKTYFLSSNPTPVSQ